MAIPDFQTLMLPLMKLTADGDDHRLADLQQTLKAQFALSDDEAGQLLPSGRQTTFANRVGWAATHLRKAGVLESNGRGFVRITPRGRELLGENLSRIDMKVLSRYPEFLIFRTASDGRSVSQPGTPLVELETPDVAIDRGVRELNEALRDELVLRIKAMPPRFFERLVVDLMLRLGYGGSIGDGQTLGGSNDGGVDGFIREDRLGLDVIYLQAKRWDGTVGRPDVQAFAGSLQGHRAKKGVFITTSSFSREAHEFVDRIDTRIVLIDGRTLADLMIATDLGVTTVQTYSIKRVDSDYFVAE